MSRIGPSTADPQSLAARGMRWHALAYVAIIGALTALNVAQGAPWWALWPTLAWGLVLAVHWFIYRALNVDERWVDARARELRDHSYDFDHMKDMEARIVNDDFSLRPRADDRSTRAETSKRER